MIQFLGIVTVIVDAAAALILITVITSPIKGKDRNKHNSTDNSKID